MKYNDIVNFIQKQPMYECYVTRRSIPATDSQLQKLVKNRVLIERTMEVWTRKGTHIEKQYRKI